MATQESEDRRPFDPLKSPRNVKELVKKFCLLTSVRGVPRIYKARSKLLKVLWLVAVVIFLCGTLLQLIVIIRGFLLFRTTQRQKVIPTIARFPDVTLCSLQPFPAHQSDHGKLFSKVEKLVHDYYEAVHLKLNEEGSNYSNFRDVHRDDLDDWNDDSDVAELEAEDYGVGKDDPHFKEMEDPDNKRRRKRAAKKGKELVQKNDDNEPIIEEETLEDFLMTNTGFYQNLNESLRISLGLHGPDSFIQSCSFIVKDKGTLRNENCKIGLHQHPQYFNCYTAKLASPTGKVIRMSIKLFLNDSIQLFYPNDYITDVDSQLHGVKVLIHEPDSYPEIYETGYDIPPGMAAKLYLTTTIKKLMPPPYGDCIHDPTPLTGENGREYRYELNTCIDQCVQAATSRKCGCITPALFRENITEYKHLPFCANLNATLTNLRWRIACMFDYYVRPPQRCNKKCKPPCRRNIYNSVLSLSKWPHESHHLQIRTALSADSNTSFDKDSLDFEFDAMFTHLTQQKNELAEHYKHGKFKAGIDVEKAKEKTKKVLMDTDTFQRNFVSITVIRDSFDVLIIQEEPETSLGEMLSKIGGTLSFWLGITLITIIEAVELLYDFFGMLLCRRRTGRKAAENGVDEVAEMSLNPGKTADGTNNA